MSHASNVAKGAARVLVYSHDSYGLGHLRRCLKIAHRLAESSEPPAILIATGSPRAQSFELPGGCDTVKLPAVTKTQAGAYRPRTLDTSLGELVSLRAELLRAAARAFAPDVVLIDHVACGLEGELLPMFADFDLSSQRPKVVLGLRDVIDEAERVRAEWNRLDVWSLIDELYDRVIVYGDPVLPTTAQELQLDEHLGDRLSFAGYLASPGALRSTRHADRPSILVTAGGGGDGQSLLRSYCDYLESLTEPTPFNSIVLTGPLLSSRRESELGARYAVLDQPVELLSFTHDVEDLLANAAGVVSMAGYNSVVELLSARRPGLLVPRSHPRREQLIRAERVSRVSDLDFCAPADRAPERISSFVQHALGAGNSNLSRVRLDGLDRTADLLSELVGADFSRNERNRRCRDVVAG